MLEQIIKVVLGFVADYVKSWYDGEKKAEAEWNAKTREGQLKSVVRADKIEVRIKTVKPKDVPISPAAWNAGRVALVLSLLMMLSGCSLFTRYVYVPDKKPIIELPERPTLSETSAFTERETKLVTYGVDLETRIQTYNEWAKTQNEANDYAEGRERAD